VGWQASAGRGHAGILRRCLDIRCGNRLQNHALFERITSSARWAATDRTVIDDLTAGLQTAGSGAGIHALLVDTSLEGGALAGHHTLGTALRRCSDVAFQTGAHRMSVDISALAVGSAGRWGTGLNYRVLHDGFNTTVYERITLVALHARAHWNVVHHLAHSIVAADSWAGIHTAVAHTGLVPGTISRECALRTTSFVGVSLVVILAATLSGKAVCI